MDKCCFPLSTVSAFILKQYLLGYKSVQNLLFPLSHTFIHIQITHHDKVKLSELIS